jgi:hypothetical protein
MAEKILTPSDSFGWIRADAADLDRKLREGDGIQWTGDPLLELRQGVVEKMSSGRPTGEIVARRWEVWRACEDGVDRMIGHWRMEEFDRILFDLARMRAESPSHVDVVDSIEAANVENEKRIWKPFRDSQGEMLEHAAKLWHDTNNPKNVFRQMPGRNKDKQL